MVWPKIDNASFGGLSAATTDDTIQKHNDNKDTSVFINVDTPSQYGFRWERKRCLLSGVSVGCSA